MGWQRRLSRRRVSALREARPRGCRLSEVDPDAPRLRPLRLGQLELEHAVGHAGLDSIRVDIARDCESPQIVSNIVLCVDRFEVLVVVNPDAALDCQHAVREVHTELPPVDARHVRPQPEAFAGLIDVDIRMIVATGPSGLSARRPARYGFWSRSQGPRVLLLELPCATRSPRDP